MQKRISKKSKKCLQPAFSDYPVSLIFQNVSLKLLKFFQRPESYYAELSFGKFTGDTFKIPNFEKTRHNTASSTSTEYAQILSAPNDQTFFENGESVKYIDVDKSEVPNESDFKANGQDESISGMLDIELMMMKS